MAERFYVNCPLSVGPVEVTGPEAHHMAAVCRLRPGDAVCLFNGDGRQYPAAVVSVARRAVALQITAVETPQRELGFRLEVAAPVPKGDRGQFLVEKLTELGAKTFVPLRTRRSVVHPGETRLEKLQRYVIEASKQCGRNVLMQVEPLADWANYRGIGGLPAVKILADPSGTETIADERWGKPIDAEGVALAVGPEGGFEEEEVAAARAAGWHVMSLGPRVLRVETAALVLAAWAGTWR
jgi:16S rRNA (uracil1498-N3)-methyltransferase